MNIGKRLQELRLATGLSQGDVEHKTGVPRTFISRIENGHTVPTLRTLEKLAEGLKVPLWQLFYGSESSPGNLAPTQWVRIQELIADSPAEDAAYLLKLRGFTGRMDEADRKMFLAVAQKMAKRGEKRG